MILIPNGMPLTSYYTFYDYLKGNGLSKTKQDIRVEQMQILYKYFDSIIEMRGDDKCYYHSVIFGSFINALYFNPMLDEDLRYELYTNILNNYLLYKRYFAKDHIYDYIEINFLRKIYNKRNKISYVEFLILYIELQEEITYIYKLLMVFTIRTNLKLFATLMKKLYSNNTPVGNPDDVLVYAGFTSFKELYDDIINDNSPANGLHVQIGLLPSLLGMNSSIIIYNKEPCFEPIQYDKGILQLSNGFFYQYIDNYNFPDIKKNSNANIILHLSGTHYNTLIPKENINIGNLFKEINSFIERIKKYKLNILNILKCSQ